MARGTKLYIIVLISTKNFNSLGLIHVDLVLLQRGLIARVFILFYLIAKKYRGRTSITLSSSDRGFLFVTACTHET